MQMADAEAEKLGDTVNALVDDVENLKILVAAGAKHTQDRFSKHAAAFELYTKTLVALSAEIGAPCVASNGLATWAVEAVEVFETAVLKLDIPHKLRE